MHLGLWVRQEVILASRLGKLHFWGLLFFSLCVYFWLETFDSPILAICFCNTTNQSKELIWPKKINRANNGSRWSQLFSSVVACHVVSSLPYCSTWSQSQPFAETDACPSCNFFFLSFDFFFFLGLLVVVVLFRELNFPTVED